MPRRSRNSTEGLSPQARNMETTTSISTEPMPVMAVKRKNATRAPRPKKKPK